jgi:hypothetical protein
MRYPTHTFDFQTVLSPTVALTNKVLDLSGSTLSESGIPYNPETTTQLIITGPDVCVLAAAIRVDDQMSTEMQHPAEMFSYTSAVIRDVDPERDMSGAVLNLFNNPIDFYGPAIAVAGSTIATDGGGKVTGRINTTATIVGGTSVTITNASVELKELRVTIVGGVATPDISGAAAPTLVTASDDSLYFSFISLYTNNIGYSHTMYDVLVGHVRQPAPGAWALDWIHRLNGLVTTRDESTPVLVIGTADELYLAYMTTGATFMSSNGIEILEDAEAYAVCGCATPTTPCADCGWEDVVLARINTRGATSAVPPTVAWKVQNGYINSIYRETRPVVSVDPANGLVYLAYECSRNLACFATSGSPNVLLHCFTADRGNHLWAQAEALVNSAGANTRPSVSADAQGNVYLAYEITAQVSGGAPVGAGEKQVEVVRFQTVLTTPGPSNTWSHTAVYTYGAWVYHAPTAAWYQARGLTTTAGQPPPSAVPTGQWSEPYSANVLYSGRVWVLSQAVDIFTADGVAGDDSSHPAIVAHPTNGYVFLTFLTTGSVAGAAHTAAHDVVLMSFTRDRVVRWLYVGGEVLNPEEITYVDCTAPYLAMDRYGNTLLSLVVYDTPTSMNLAVFHFDMEGVSRWGYPRTETEKYPVYMLARTGGPNSVFPTAGLGVFSSAGVGIGKGYTNIFTATVTTAVAPGQTAVGVAGVTRTLAISVFHEDVYYKDRSAFSYMLNIRSICTCGTQNCGCS